MRAQYLTRIRILAGIIVAIVLLVIVRLYFLQIAHGEAYRVEANDQYVRSSRDIFNRGSIYFTKRTGERIAAASLKSGYLLAIHPNQIQDAEEIYTALSKYTELDRELFLARLGKQDDPYEEMARQLEESVAQRIEEDNLTGVQLFREHWRYYPGDSLAGHVLGFVGFGVGGEVQTGQYGLERYWESVLTRKNEELYVNFFAEVFANARDALTEEEHAVEREGEIVTNIEPIVQQTLERVLLETQETWKANEIGGIIINPKTGAIYALGALPTFNPNSYTSVDDVGVFGNPFVERVYEMGSIVKPIAMAIALDVGVVTPETTYNDTGTIMLDTKPISNYDGRARGVVNMQEVLNQSLNVGMAFVAEQVGGEVLGGRMKAFGFGEETGIDAPFELRGLITNLDSPRKVEYATAAFGQGIALTPIGMVRALCALGNGGYLVTPHFVETIVYESGEEADVAPDEKIKVLGEETSEEITRMLVNVVDTALRGGTVKKERYQIAAKTGTAQIAKKTERGYYDDRYLHSFFGYFPAYDPQFLIFLYHLEPQNAQYASETLTDPFMELVDFLINYYDIPPDR